MAVISLTSELVTWTCSLRSSAGDQLKSIPQTPGDAGSREVARNFDGAEERDEGGGGDGDGICVEKHLGEVCEGKFLFVVMVTGSVVRSKNQHIPSTEA